MINNLYDYIYINNSLDFIFSEITKDWYLGELYGMTTAELDAKIENSIFNIGYLPAFKNYQNYPSSSCISVNDEMVHSVPNDRVIKNTDVLKIDIGLYCPSKDLHADRCDTFVGCNADREICYFYNRVQKVLYDYFNSGLIKPGLSLYDMAKLLNDIANDNDVYVSPNFMGHGIGKELHMKPSIYHYLPSKRPYDDYVLQENDIFTNEPVFIMNPYVEPIFIPDWTWITNDGSVAMQLEHTVLITKDGCKILGGQSL